MRFKPAFRLPAHRPVAIHVNYHSDKSEKMKLAEQYYLGGDAGALDRCGERSPDGCAADPVGVAVLEAAVKGEINDGFASSRGWGKAGPAALRGGCAPQPAWGGAFNTSLVTYDLPFRVPFPGLPLRCAPEAQALCSAMDAALASAPAAQPHELLLCVVDGAHAAALPALLRSLDALALAPRAVVVLLDDAAAQAAAGLGGAPPAAQLLRLAAGSPLRRDAGGAALPPAAVKWALVQLALRLGVSPLVADPGTVFLANPFEHLYRDADVEAASDGWDEASAWGYDHVVDDPLMGWSRYCAHGRGWVGLGLGLGFGGS